MLARETIGALVRLFEGPIGMQSTKAMVIVAGADIKEWRVRGVHGDSQAIGECWGKNIAFERTRNARRDSLDQFTLDHVGARVEPAGSLMFGGLLLEAARIAPVGSSKTVPNRCVSSSRARVRVATTFEPARSSA